MKDIISIPNITSTQTTANSTKFGFPLRKENNTSTIMCFGIPLLKKTTHEIQICGGGGGRYTHRYEYSYAFLGYTFYITPFLRKLNSSLNSLTPPPYLTKSPFPLGKAFCEDNNLSKHIKALVQHLSPQSTKTALMIIAREIKAYQSHLSAIFTLTQDELDALDELRKQFYPHILTLAPNLHYYKSYYLPINHFEVGVFYTEHGLHNFSKATLEAIKHKDIIDVGGYIGDSALIFDKYTHQNVHSFEASPTNFALLLETIRLNNLRRVIPINKALGAKEQTLSISLYGGGSSLIYDYGYKHEQAEVITLDSYVKEHELDIGFIKVDIEGFEQEFLQGAKQTICTQKPAMLISIYHQAHDFFGIKPLIESWNLGYTFHIYKPIDGSISVECSLYCEVIEASK